MAKRLIDYDSDEMTIFLNGLILLSRIFRGPDKELCLEMKASDFEQELNDLADVLGEKAIDAARAIQAYLKGFEDVESLFDDLEETYVELFINTRGSIGASLYHSSYDSEDGLLMGRPARMMHEMLSRYGLSISSDVNEPPDHLSNELELLFFMLESYWNNNDKNQFLEAAAFANKEMAPWVGLFASKLDIENGRSFYRQAAILTVHTIEIASEMVHDG